MRIYYYLLLIVILSSFVIAEDKYILDQQSLVYVSNAFNSDRSTQIAILFPYFLLSIVVIFALLDQVTPAIGTAAIAVTIGSIAVLILGYVTTILPIRLSSLITMVIMCLLFVYQMAKR